MEAVVNDWAQLAILVAYGLIVLLVGLFLVRIKDNANENRKTKTQRRPYDSV